MIKLMGHDGVTTSQRYVYPASETVSRVFERFEVLNPAARSVVGTILGIAPEATPAKKK
jgi:hypothetical protein